MPKDPVIEKAKTTPTKMGEVFGILLILTAILLALALISYNASDPSLHTVSLNKPSNFVGRVGAYIASALLDALGVGAYFLPFLSIFFSYFYFTGRNWQVKLSQLAGYLVFMVAFCGFVRLYSNQVATMETGGIVGMLLGDLLKYLFGKVGAYILLGALFLISLVIAIDLSFGRLGALMAKAAKAVADFVTALLSGAKKPSKADVVQTVKKARTPLIHGLKEKSVKEPDKKSQIDTAELLPPEYEEKQSEKGKLPKIKVKMPEERPEPASQIEFVGFTGNYQFPSVDLLEDHGTTNVPIDADSLMDQSRILEAKLESFKILGRVVEVHPGPVITMFEFEPAPGVKVSQIANREDDLAMALRAESIRIVAPIPGKGAVGIEVPNVHREIVSLKELIASEKFNTAKGRLTFVLGKDIGGRVSIADLAKMPHLLIAGTTGSGKSVFVNSIICSLLYHCSPTYLRMLMVDPKMLELSDYAEIPHLLHPVVTDPRKAAVILRWAVGEMEDRYRKMADFGVRNIENYNNKVQKILDKKEKHPSGTILNQDTDNPEHELEKMPYILIIIDELSDLMIVAKKEVEESITRLAQMARAAGIHLILATQRPSVDVITGVIKANFPARISFKVSSKIDSRTVLDTGGADNLLGAGDMLFKLPTSSRIDRIHGAFVTENEIQRVVESLRGTGQPRYDATIVRAGEVADDPEAYAAMVINGNGSGDEEELVEQAWDIIRRERKASISYIQRRMKIGYNKAASIIEILERKGFISPSDGTSRPREILAPPDDDGAY